MGKDLEDYSIHFALLSFLSPVINQHQLPGHKSIFLDVQIRMTTVAR